MKLVTLPVACRCGTNQSRPKVPALRMCSSAADAVRALGGLPATWAVMTWRCSNCYRIHQVTALDMGLAAGQPLARYLGTS